MPKRRRRLGSDATALQELSETISSGAATMLPARITVTDSVKAAATVSPTEGEIATIAYQLWLDNGCPLGSEQEDWFRAEAMVKNEIVAKCENLSRRPSIPRCDTPAEFEIVAEFRWEGHWEAWEMEWGGARWVWD